MILGGRILYRMGDRIASSFLTLLSPFGSGVARPFDSGTRDPPFDSRFFSVSFLALDARSRTKPSSCFALKSGLRGDDIVGAWSVSSRVRF